MKKQFDIHDIFSPAQEILNPDKFAGRKNSIAKAIKALCRPGTSILVYGERGAGKTSFIEMVKLIAQDQVELIHRYKMSRLKPPSGFKYKILSIECDEDVDTTEKVLQRLITSPEGISGLIGPCIEKIETTVKNSLSIKLLQNLMSVGFSGEEKITAKSFQEVSVYELFTNLILIINQNVLKEGEGLLITIDEFDRVKDNSKMASLIKTLSKNKTKFLISGIATSYTELIKAHASIERQLYDGKIKISPMSDDEIDNLFVLANRNSNNLITYEKGFIKEVKERSYGFPYYVQLFGQLALDHVISVNGYDNKFRLAKKHLINGLKEFAEYEPKLEEIYKTVVGNDQERELLLKALAAQIPNRIDQDNVFGFCRKRGVRDPKKVLSVLLSIKEPEFLKRVDTRGISFKDPLFKIYSKVRSPLYLKETKEGLSLGQ
ncbi:MAG: P-loop NTPase fold protein [Thermodesulfobacteriota bacterium]